MPCFYGKLHAIILYSSARFFVFYITNTFRCLLWYSVSLSLSQPTLCIPWEIMSSTGISVYITQTAFHCGLCLCAYICVQVSSSLIDKNKKQSNSRKQINLLIECLIFCYLFLLLYINTIKVYLHARTPNNFDEYQNSLNEKHIYCNSFP